MTTINIAKVAQEWLRVRDTLAELEQLKSQLEADIKEVFASKGTDTYIINGEKIALVSGERAKYDADLLKDLISPATFKKVTKTEVDGKKFKASLEIGLIGQDIADAITTLTPYTQLRVTQLAKGEEKDDKATTKVA